jgi:glucan phosphoethanolaminetransferase (alkaline phosphatase superfamily)
MWRLPLHHRGWRVEALGKLRVMGIALAVILGLVVGLGSHYASFFREYKSIAPTEQTSVPLLLWVGENRDLDDDSILDGTKRATTHDTISPSLLTYFEIGTSALHEQTAAFALSPHAPRVAR